MNAALLTVCLTATTAFAQRPDAIFTAPGIEVRTETRDDKSFSYVLYNRIYIGRQYHKARELPTTYFHDKSPIGMVLRDPNRFPPKAEPPIAVLGMDIGALAAYGKPGQTFHFTERLPTFVKLSLPDKGEKRYFTYVQDALDRGVKLTIFEGEPRAMLEKHGREKFYKLIVVQTYKLPVIEVHKELMTKEAVEMLMSKLTEDGVLAFHTSNRYYDLAPIIASAAKELKLACRNGSAEGFHGDRDNDFRFASDWVMVARDEKYLAGLESNEKDKVEWRVPISRLVVRGKFIEKKIDKEFLWTDKGEQSFRGLYRSDPQIDKLHNVLNDLEDFIVDRVGIDSFQVQSVARPVHDAVRKWSANSADVLNRPLPQEKKSDQK